MKDYQDALPKHHCHLCGCEIYSREDYYELDGKIICERCVEESRVNGEEYYEEEQK